MIEYPKHKVKDKGDKRDGITLGIQQQIKIQSLFNRIVSLLDTIHRKFYPSAAQTRSLIEDIYNHDEKDVFEISGSNNNRRTEYRVLFLSGMYEFGASLSLSGDSFGLRKDTQEIDIFNHIRLLEFYTALQVHVELRTGFRSVLPKRIEICEVEFFRKDAKPWVIDSSGQRGFSIERYYYKIFNKGQSTITIKKITLVSKEKTIYEKNLEQETIETNNSLDGYINRSEIELEGNKMQLKVLLKSGRIIKSEMFSIPN